ncbi:MAG: aldehyde dehydrogenase family protein [Gammaproteobacteria bacterium]|nr:aldehyde dehydrogenase family protein [Gammaproteobacteria bacterium]
MSQQPAINHYQNYIGGKWVDSEKRIEVFDPATEELVGTIACAGLTEIDRAVKAARDCVASGVLSKPRPSERAGIIYRIAQQIRALAEQGAALLVRENGKTLDQARDEFENAARYFEYYAGMTDKIEGRSIPLGEDYIDFTVYEPMGVSAQIVPWNFPVDICARSLAPALAAGNAVIVKSPELCPLSMTFLAIACERAGLPPGALSMLCGYGSDAGANLIAHSGIDQIVFTGSVPTGQSILKTAAKRAIPCVMELGGKSAAVVFPDADIEALMSSIDWGIFFNAGQVCSAMSRLIVHEDIHDEVVAWARALAEAQLIGNGFDAVTLTPVASADQQEKILGMCRMAEQQGARLVIGGTAPNRGGYFVEPTIFENVLPEMNIFQNEVFGPVLSVTKFKTEQQAWQLANATDYGLVAGIFTNDLNIALRGSRLLKAGQIFVNEWYAGGIETPFGGMKLSGFGREKGQEALYNYVHTKNVAIRLRGGW